MNKEVIGDKILCYGRHIDKKDKPHRHPLFKNHRCQHAIATGGKGRPAYCKLVVKWGKERDLAGLKRELKKTSS